MSKIETLRRLPTPNELQQSAESVSQQIEILRQQIEGLPQALAQELAPLAQIGPEVSAALMAIDQITAEQRRTLDQLTAEMGTAAAKNFESTAIKLAEPITKLATSAAQSESTLFQLKAITEALPVKIRMALEEVSNSTIDLKASTDAIRREAAKAKTPLWKTGLMLYGVALAAVATSTAVGLVVSSKPAPPPAVQQIDPSIQTNADWARLVWSRATPKERELLTSIASRPEPSTRPRR